MTTSSCTADSPMSNNSTRAVSINSNNLNHYGFNHHNGSSGNSSNDSRCSTANPPLFIDSVKKSTRFITEVLIKVEAC